MKKLVIWIFFFFPLTTWSQALRIDDVWQYKGSERLKQELSLKNAIALQDEAIAREAWLPVFYGDLHLQNNLIIPTTPVPAIAFNPNASPDAITPLRFATRWTSRAGVQLDWGIFDPVRSKEIALKQVAIEKASITSEESLHQWRVDATLAYTAVVLANLQHQQATQDSITYAQILNSIKERVEAGRALPEELIEAQQEMERIRIRRIEAWAVLQETSLSLRQEIPQINIQQVSSGLEEIIQFLQTYLQPTYQQDLLALELKETQLLVQSENRKRWPSINLQGYYGGQYFDNRLALHTWDQWYGNSYAAISIRIPLSEHFWGTKTLLKTKLQTQLKDLDYQAQKDDDQLIVAQRLIKNSTFQQKLNHLNEIVHLAEQQELIQRASYDAGRTLLSTYHQSLLAKTQAYQQVWQVHYDWVQAILNP
jgi:outer membrane protein